MKNKKSKNEMKLRLFLRHLSYYKSRDYLISLYPEDVYPLSGKHARNYDMFIDYMGQGFNRKRDFLVDKYSLSTGALNSIAHKYDWTGKAKVWEKLVVDKFIDVMFPPSFRGSVDYYGNPVWLRCDGEGYFAYFCFLCWLYLNVDGVYSQPSVAGILSEEGVGVVSQTLNQFSARYHWISRCNDYNVSSVVLDWVDDGSEYKDMLSVLGDSCLSNVVHGFMGVWSLLKNYGVGSDVFVVALDGVISSTVQAALEDGVTGFGWVNYFDGDDLLEELLVYHLKLDPCDFVRILVDGIGCSGDRLDDLIVEHCGVFGECVDDYRVFSGG